MIARCSALGVHRLGGRLQSRVSAAAPSESQGAPLLVVLTTTHHDDDAPAAEAAAATSP